MESPDAAHPRFTEGYNPNRNVLPVTNGFKIALVQMSVGVDKLTNISRALDFIKNAKSKGAQIVSLPECFNSPYGTKFFNQYAEQIPSGETCVALSNAAKENNLIIIGGSIPERSDGKLYNTLTVWNESGALVAKHRKVHLFDVDIPGKITFKESEVLAAGNSLNTFSYGKLKIGLGVCYDMRFEEMARVYANKGCNMLIYPGAFNMTTGPMHWELLARGRANDLQLYMATISPATSTKGYVAWGHSTLVDPWGKVVAKAGHDEELVIADIDLNVVDEVRSQIPTSKQRRLDIYSTDSKGEILESKL